MLGHSQQIVALEIVDRVVVHVELVVRVSVQNLLASLVAQAIVSLADTASQ